MPRTTSAMAMMMTVACAIGACSASKARKGGGDDRARGSTAASSGADPVSVSGSGSGSDSLSGSGSVSGSVSGSFDSGLAGTSPALRMNGTSSGTADVARAAVPASWAVPRMVAAGGLGDGLFALPAVQHGALALVPIATTEPSTEDYLVLDDAMAEGLVEIAERGGVNALTITNRSNRPLFLLAGEVVIGGKQDRIIGKNTIIAARTTEELPVFCVEHGRWSGRQATFASAGALAHSTLREKASFEAQGDVWQEVAAKNARRGTANGTDTYRQTAAQQTADATLAAWDEDLDAQLRALPAEVRAMVVGYAVALGGEVVAVDVFDSPALFGRLDRKLRRSYYAEAIDAEAPAGARVPAVDDVRAFLTRADAAPEQPAYDNAEAATVNQLADDAASTKVMAKRAKPGGGGKVKPVFKSVAKRSKKAVAAPPSELGNLPAVGDGDARTQQVAPALRPRPRTP